MDNNNKCGLMEVTKNLLKQDKRTLIEIYSQSGIPYYWLKKFSAGDVLHPSVNRVEALYEFLTGRKLLEE